MKNRICLPLAFLGILHGAILLAGLLAPYDPEAQDRGHPYAPPSRLHMVDQTGQFHFHPFIYEWVERAGSPGVYEEDRSRMYPLRLFPAEESGTGRNMNAGKRLFGVDNPGHVYLLGTDGFGRDQLSRLLYGGRISLLSGFLATSLSLGLALLLGSIAGYFGRWLDDVIMRAAELLLALPWLYCLFALRARLPLHITPERTLFMLIFVMSLRGWARPARLIRGLVMTAKERDFVLAARGFGASDTYLLAKHILPQTFGILLTQAALLIPQYTLAEVAFSFLGLGVSEPTPTWGNMLANLQHYHVLASYWWIGIPGLVLIPTFFAYHTLAGALHEQLPGGYSARARASS